MNNTGKTITAIGAAAAIGTGVLLTTMRDEPAPVEPESQPQIEFMDDIKPIEVPVFTVDVLRIDVPKIEICGVEIPDIESLSPETVRVVTHLVETIGVESLSPVQIRIVVQAIERLDGDVPKIQQLQRVLAATMQDQRMLQYDRTLTIHNEALAAWLDIYSRPLPPPIEYIPLPGGIRMIAELRSTDHAAANLAFYRRQGYNACLITIYGTEGVADVMRRVGLVRSAGMDAWIAWAGPESLAWSIYQEPAKISRLLDAAAPLCRGYLPAWRRTSAHLVAQDAQYIEHLVQQVRSANPEILVVGESYYGQTWENLPHINQRGWVARDNAPRNQSGVLIAGIATQNFAIETMLNTTFSRWLRTPRLAQVLGERAYYASANDTKKDFFTNLRIKQQLERRFLRAGCVGTVTLHGDGSDRGATLMTVDDLGKYRIE